MLFNADVAMNVIGVRRQSAALVVDLITAEFNPYTRFIPHSSDAGLVIAYNLPLLAEICL